MSTQPDLLDAGREQAAKREGMGRAATNRAERVAYARLIAAREHKRLGRPICMDDVQAVLIPEGIDLGNAAGSVFQGHGWMPVGWTRSEREGSHANRLRMWVPTVVLPEWVVVVRTDRSENVRHVRARTARQAGEDVAERLLGPAQVSVYPANGAEWRYNCRGWANVSARVQCAGGPEHAPERTENPE